MAPEGSFTPHPDKENTIKNKTNSAIPALLQVECGVGVGDLLALAWPIDHLNLLPVHPCSAPELLLCLKTQASHALHGGGGLSISKNKIRVASVVPARLMPCMLRELVAECPIHHVYHCIVCRMLCCEGRPIDTFSFGKSMFLFNIIWDYFIHTAYNRELGLTSTSTSILPDGWPTPCAPSLPDAWPPFYSLPRRQQEASRSG